MELGAIGTRRTYRSNMARYTRNPFVVQLLKRDSKPAYRVRQRAVCEATRRAREKKWRKKRENNENKKKRKRWRGRKKKAAGALVRVLTLTREPRIESGWRSDSFTSVGSGRARCSLERGREFVVVETMSVRKNDSVVARTNRCVAYDKTCTMQRSFAMIFNVCRFPFG